MSVRRIDLIEKAREVLLGNLKVGYSRWANSDYRYVCPDKDAYPHQWFWDSCFHAIVLSHLDLDLAKNEIRSLLKVQDKNGFLPHMIFWDHSFSKIADFFRPLESGPTLRPKTSQLIQPPLIAQAVEAIYKESKDGQFLREVLPKILNYYRFLERERDPDGDYLISIIAPYESGMDQSPSYDPLMGLNNNSALRTFLAGRFVTLRNLLNRYDLNKIFKDDYFNVEDVLVNSIYIKNLQVLSKLLHEIDEEEKARYFHVLAKKALDSLINKCYDREDCFFYDRYGNEESWSKVKTIKGLIPLILDLPKRIVNDLVSHLFDRKEFDLPFAVPTVAANESTFSPTPALLVKEPIIWRGPTWINTNWYIYLGLKKHGFKREAKMLKNRTIELISLSGFREFFNPFSGEGYGASNFSWSTLIVDMILSEP